MSKTAVSTLITDIKLLGDYNIVDSDLDSLIVIGMNYILKRMKQWFVDEMLWDEITAHDTFDTVADQEYIELGTETPDFDYSVKLSERTNDSTIEIITWSEFRDIQPDPTANTGATPDFASFFANRIYLSPTPSGAITLYLDYIKLITKVTSSSTLPFEDKYDELVVAGVMEYLVKFFDRTNNTMINAAKKDVEEKKHTLIVAASKNMGINLQSQSRKPEIPPFSPRKVIT